jgi:HlyD family secretion protein
MSGKTPGTSLSTTVRTDVGPHRGAGPANGGLDAPRWPGGRYLATGCLALVFLVGGLGSWSAVAEISGAVIAPASVEVEGNRQVVQHPTGGVTAEILARDGDRVEEGDVLLRLDGEKLVSEFAVVEAQYHEILARKGRLAAERDGAEEIAFAPDLVASAARAPAIAALLAAETQQFEAHVRALEEEASALRERIVQIGRQIEGMEAEGAAASEQAALIAREIESQDALFAKGLTRQSDLLAPQRELARLRGLEGQVAASTAESRAKIAEIEIEILRLGTERRRDAIAELRELEYREIELRERRTVLREELARLNLRAPATGIVYGSTADTLRGVIRAAEPVMFIVPEEMPLVVRARVEPTDIDNVRPGQPAILRFPAFNARTTPEVEGVVASVSADAIQDDRTGETYYRAEIRLVEDAEAAIDGLALLPGMPVETFIQTEPRTPLSYLVKPITDQFARAFRES